ncbi:MAG TPA: NAD(P)H-hydrate dehydratase [Streptosporangiaceae bacterium]|nr:NAD(P)H-hydrate dehydratase [Streptosporangiaceae bacterium]
MRRAHTVAVVRAAERALMATVPEGALMQRAAAGLAATCASALDRVYGARVVVLAGSGDNGGDALYAGARLAARGAQVVAIAIESRLHAAAAAELLACGGRVAPASSDTGKPAGTAADAMVDAANGLAPGDGAADIGAPALSAIAMADLIIDGLTGIGGHGGLREPAASLARLTENARRSGALVVAVDLPSGIDADTGEVTGVAIRADVTVTFGTVKPGLLIDPGAEHAGPTELIDIGLGPYLPEPAVVSLQAADVAAMLPHPSAESDKYRRGVLGLVAGSEQYTGAAVLAAGGAIKGGAGMVRLLSAAPAISVARQRWPEAVLTTYDPHRPGDAVETAGRVQAWAIGPGIGTGETAHTLLATVLASDVPVLIDADGLTVLAARRDLLPRSGLTLITPHAGELARLLKADRSDIEARRLHYATAAAAELGVTILLKGSTTVIAEPDPACPVRVNSTGTSWLATAGSGDVLSGLAGSLLAQGLPPADAAAIAAYLHGLAGRLAADDAPIGASDLITAIPAAIRVATGGRG